MCKDSRAELPFKASAIASVPLLSIALPLRSNRLRVVLSCIQDISELQKLCTLSHLASELPAAISSVVRALRNYLREIGRERGL